MGGVEPTPLNIYWEQDNEAATVCIHTYIAPLCTAVNHIYSPIVYYCKISSLSLWSNTQVITSKDFYSAILK